MTLEIDDAVERTVNERLSAAGLTAEFDQASERGDEARLRVLLEAAHVGDADIEAAIERMHAPGWAVIVETRKRFGAGDRVEATQIIQSVVLPLIDDAGRRTERARVQIAMIRLSGGTIAELRRAARIAAVDWRDVLVAAGLADGEWRRTLASEGYAVPAGTDTMSEGPPRRRQRRHVDTPKASGRHDDAVFRTRRIVSARPQKIFAAFARPELLTRWWGPSGFTSTFERFEFKVGGRWTFLLHGPEGASYPNESVFLEIEEPSKIVIHHVSKPRYVLTVTLAEHEEGAAIDWAQEFEDSGVAARIRHIVEPANEQNLDRLEAVLAEEK